MAIDCIKNKKGKAWRARVLLKSGKRISKCFSRKIDAEQWEAKLKLEDADPTRIIREPILFQKLTEEFLRYVKADLQEASYQRYDSIIRLRLNPAFGKMMVSSISKKDVLEFKVDLGKQGLSSSNQHTIFRALKTILRKGIELDLIDHDPTTGIKVPKKGFTTSNYWNESEIYQFLNQIKDHPRYPLYLIALNTGMRAGEIFGLKWDCVDFDHRLIHIKRTFDQKSQTLKETTKTHKRRSIGINTALEKVLRRLHREKTSEFVLERNAIGCGDTSHLARAFSSDCRRLGLRPIKFHELRHTFATQLVRKSGDLHAASRVLGHTTEVMTELYAHFSNDHAVQVANMISYEADEESKVVPLRAIR